jgi:tRNA pseudouridine55 synthase
MRRILHTKRIGHTGTLDPFATGLLVILVGKATRLAQFLDKDEKTYDAEIHFGFETDTGDRTGEPKSEKLKETAERLQAVDWEKALPKFRGKFFQTPPMYSAKKVDGKKLYELARSGIEVERKPVEITINELQMFDIKDDTANMHVRCSAGTFIRTLAEDIGKEIGIGAHLNELRRTAAGAFSIENALPLKELSALEDPSSKLISMNEAVGHLRSVELSEDRIGKTLSGLSTRVQRNDLENGEPIRMLGVSKDLIAIGLFNAEENILQPKIVLG